MPRFLTTSELGAAIRSDPSNRWLNNPYNAGIMRPILSLSAQRALRHASRYCYALVEGSPAKLGQSAHLLRLLRPRPCLHSRGRPNEKGASRPRPLLQPPPRGTRNSLARRSLSGARVRGLLSGMQEPYGPGWRFCKMQLWTIARRSNCVHGRTSAVCFLLS